MAGWSTVADENTVDRCKTPKKLDSSKLSNFPNLQSKRSALEGESEELLCLFRRLLKAFLKEFCSVGSLRPLPPMAGNGKTVDLFKLFLNVTDRGGFDAISKNGLWEKVAQESGLDLDHSASVKLIYVKYLDTFGRWLNRVVAAESNSSSLELSGISMELESELKGFLSEMKKIYDPGKGGNSMDSGAELKHFLSEMKQRYDKYYHDKESLRVDAMTDIEGLGMAGKRLDKCLHEEKPVILDSNARESPSSRKRKREFTAEMLEWLTQVAKDPCDLAIGSLPERSKWASYGSEEPWKQVLLFRAAMSQGRNIDPLSEKNWQKHQKMHPCMYADSIGSSYNLRERLSFGGSPFNERKCAKLEGFSGKDLTTANSDDEEESDVPIGSGFQAEVPEWTAIASESDSKWLGTRVWPLEKEQNRSLLIERDPIGKGRHDSCGCEVPGSVGCVRFHLTEKRAKLKLELSSAFYSWDFDKVGEDILHSWTTLEQKKVNALIKTPPLLDQSFFEQMGKILPTKSRANIVSYYYNAILLQYRAKQNRISPCVVDSDPDDPDSDPATDDPSPLASKSPKPVLLSPKKPNRRTR